MTALIDSLSSGVPGALTEVITLGRTLKKRAGDVLAYFDRPGKSHPAAKLQAETPLTPARSFRDKEPDFYNAQRLIKIR